MFTSCRTLLVLVCVALFLICSDLLFVYGEKFTTPIKHVVVLMLENRSFDHTLGYLKQTNPNIDGLNGNESFPFNCSDPYSPRQTVSNTAPWIIADPDHTYTGTYNEVFGYSSPSDIAPMNGFLEVAMNTFGGNSTEAYEVISSFNVSNIPTFTSLIDNFALFQRYFSSVPGETWPNRLYIHSGTSHGTIANDALKIALGFPQKTIYDLLEENNYDWNVFFSDVPDTILFRSGRTFKSLEKLRPMHEFEAVCMAGNLAHFTFISPRYFDIPCFAADDQHPPHDFSLGENSIKNIYEILRKSPIWNETAFIVTYDEHGGFADHVSMPMKNIPNPDGMNSTDGPAFDFTRLGVRVPMILISPWIDAGIIINDPTDDMKPTPDSQFDHTSIISTVRSLFNISTSLTKRDNWAAHFDSLFSLRTTPRTDCPETLPIPKIPKGFHPTGRNVLSGLQKQIIDIMTLISGKNEADEIAKFLRTEYEGAQWIINLLYKHILKRNIPKSLELALKLKPGHELKACEIIRKTMDDERKQAVDKEMEKAQQNQAKI